MGYRAVLLSSTETVQDIELSARRRLEEATTLYVWEKPHTAIYVAGLSAEMYLKTACYFLEGANPADPAAAYFEPVRSKKYNPPFKAAFESGHGLGFWSEELIHRRTIRGLPMPRSFVPAISHLLADWFIGMRYRPGLATADDAAAFITQVEWLANNHAFLRR